MLSSLFFLLLGEALVGNEAVDQLVKFNAALADHSSQDNPHLIDVTGLRIGVLGLSGIFVWLVASGQTGYPRWFAAFNPILLVLASFLIYFIVPAIGGYLMPIAMNVAHFILFSVSLLLMNRERLPA